MIIFYAGHRKRLADKFLDGKCTQYETLEFLLTFAIPRRDLRPLTRRLLKTFGSYSQVLVAPYTRLMEVSGVGPRVA